MKRLLTLALLSLTIMLCTATNSFCQTEDEGEYQDVVLLENGGVLTGKIVERTEGEQIVIVTRDGQELEVPWWRIDLVSTVDTFEADRKALADKPKAISPHMTGYNGEIITQFGVLAGQSEGLVSPTLVVGVLVDERLYFSGGLGWEMLGNYRLVPLFVDFRYYFERKSIIPYLYADAGYAFGSNERHELGDSGGLMAGFGIGMRSYIARRGSVNLQVGYRAQGYKKVDGKNTIASLFGFTIGLCFY